MLPNFHKKTIHPPKKMWPVSHKELQEKNLQLMSEVEKLWTESDLHKLDPLTRLNNHGSLEKFKDILIDSDKIVVFIMFDADKLKQINDKRGHPDGDIYLQKIANFIRSNIRHDDFAARYGGDEFAGLIDIPPGIDPQIVLDKIKKRLYKLLKEYNQNTEIKIGFSIGESISTQPPHDPRHLLCEADKAMYDMKRNTEPQRKKNNKNSL